LSFATSSLSGSAGLCEGRDFVSDASHSSDQVSTSEANGFHEGLTNAGGHLSVASSPSGGADLSGGRDAEGDAVRGLNPEVGGAGVVLSLGSMEGNLESGRGDQFGRSIGPSRVEPESRFQSEESCIRGMVAAVETTRADGVGPNATEPVILAGVDSNLPVTSADADPTERFSVAHIAETQSSDYTCSTILQLLLTHENKPTWDEVQNKGVEVRVLYNQWESLSVVDGALYRKFHIHNGTTSHLQIVLPASLRKEYVMLVHNNNLHMGVSKTLAELAKRVYFPGARTLVELVLKTCHECARYHRGPAPHQTYLRPMQAARPLDVLQIDLVGSLTEGRKSNGQRGFYWILTAIDTYTKYLFAVPLKNKSAETVVDALVNEVILKSSIPSAIQSDLGKEFQAEIVQGVIRVLGADQLRSTSMHPSTQGAVERVHSTMHRMFAKLVNDRMNDWPDVLSKIVFAYNMTQHSATSYSPHFLFYGRECNCALDLITRIPVEHSPTNIHDYALNLVETLHEAFDFVREHAGNNIQRMKRYYDAKVKPREFSVGDFVYYHYPRNFQGKFRKWQRFYVGPYRVMQRVNATNSIIRKTPRSAPFVVHHDKLKLYHGDTPRAWTGFDGAVADRPTQLHVDLGNGGDCATEQTTVHDSQTACRNARPAAEQGRKGPTIAPTSEPTQEPTVGSSVEPTAAPARPRRAIQLPLRFRH